MAASDASSPSPTVQDDSCIVREYRPEDDAACRDLEARASNQAPPWTKWFMDMQFINFASFDARVRQFECGGVTLVAEMPGVGVVGTICGAVKEAAFGGRKAKVCYLFDLRVSPDFRNRGLGARLSVEVERICVERYGVERMYLTVNQPNQRARRLYEKLGYTYASTRAPSAKPLAGVKISDVPDGCDISILHGDEAAQALSAAVGQTDGALGDFSRLVASKNFLGLVRCRAGDSEAGVGIWDSSALSGFAMTRLIFPSSWYFSPVGRAAGRSLLVGAPLLWGGLLWHLARATCFKWLAAAAVIGALGAMGAWKARPFVWFAGSIMYQSLSEKPVARMRGRLFGPWAKGAEGKRLLGAALCCGERLLQDGGFVFRICNMDKAHPLRAELGPPAFETFFMQKNLRELGDELPAWAPDSFHDPRDI